MFSEYVPSSVAENRLSRMGTFHCRLERRLFCGAKYLVKRVTCGAELANTVPLVPSAHVVGIDAGFSAYAFQSGTGVAAPTHVICCNPLGNPVLSIAEPMLCAESVFSNSPTPPRTTARGPRTMPSNAASCGASPYVHENPTRGLANKRLGTTSLRRPKIRSTSGLNVGADEKRLAS